MTLRSMGSSDAIASSIAARVSLLVSASSGAGSGEADPTSSPDAVSHSTVVWSSASAPNDENVAARWCRPAARR